MFKHNSTIYHPQFINLLSLSQKKGKIHFLSYKYKNVVTIFSHFSRHEDKWEIMACAWTFFGRLHLFLRWEWEIMILGGNRIHFSTKNFMNLIFDSLTFSPLYSLPTSMWKLIKHLSLSHKRFFFYCKKFRVEWFPPTNAF